MTDAFEFGAANVLTVVLVGWMLFDGYWRRSDGFFRWPMFTSHCAVVAELRRETPDGGWEPVNMFHHLPAHVPWITPREFDVLLKFLSESGRIEGRGTFYGNSRTYDLRIADSRVDIERTRAQF